MQDPTIDEIEAAFSNAKNLNATLKNYLKREVGGNEAVARFVKNFRAAIAGGRQGSLRSFIEANTPLHIEAFFALGRYAYPELFAATVEKIINSYADDFNATYKKNGDVIEMVDEAKFSAIVQEVVKIVESALASSNLPNSNFMKLMIYSGVFEPEVLKEVLKIV